MAEQQLVDYIKKAKEAGQSDDQTKNLLYKNGWTSVEVADAFTALNPQPVAQPQPVIQPQPQPVQQPQTTKPVEARPQPVSQIQSQAQPLQAIQQNNMPRMRKSHMAVKLLMVLIILVVLGGIGVFAAGQYFNFSFNPLQESPDSVIRKMMTNMAAVKSNHAIIQSEVNITGASVTSDIKLTAKIEGDGDASNSDNLKNNSNVSLQISSPAYGDVTANADIIIVDDVAYVKITNITGPIVNASQPQALIAQIKNKWLQLDKNSASALSQSQIQQLGVTIDPDQNNSEIIKTIKDLILAENMISFDKNLGEQTIGGKKAYHYLLKIKKDKIKDLLEKIIISQGAQDMLVGIPNALAEAVGDIGVEVWIGKTDYMLYKVSVNSSVDIAKIYPTVNVKVDVKLSEDNSNFNKSVSIQKPAGAQKIEEIVAPLMKLQKIQADMSQIAVLSGTYFSSAKSFTSFCRNGLLNGYLPNYGTDLVGLNNDILAQGAVRPSCFAGVASYCISSMLADGTNICIDETGATGTTKCIFAQTECK